MTTFESAHFRWGPTFCGREPDHMFLKGELNFKNVSLSDPNQPITFKWANLRKAEFLNTDISLIDFIDVTWDRQNDCRAFFFKFSSWRHRLHDETLWREARRKQKNREADNKYLTELSSLYRQLKEYYKGRGENQLVGHFHYGHMDIQFYQKTAPRDVSFLGKYWWHLRHKFTHWIYRETSGYGEDYFRAFTILILVMTNFALAYFLILEYGNSPFSERKDLFGKVADSFLFSFQAGSLSRFGFYEVPKDIITRFLYAIESILAPAQFAFLIIALRNRFRRWT